MGYMNYTANEMKTKGKEEKEKKKEEAQACLKAWEVLQPEEKREFLCQFEESGGTKSKDSLKYCLEYVHQVSTQKSVRVKVNENFHTRPLYIHTAIP